MVPHLQGSNRSSVDYRRPESVTGPSVITSQGMFFE